MRLAPVRFERAPTSPRSNHTSPRHCAVVLIFVGSTGCKKKAPKKSTLTDKAPSTWWSDSDKSIKTNRDEEQAREGEDFEEADRGNEQNPVRVSRGDGRIDIQA